MNVLNTLEDEVVDSSVVNLSEGAVSLKDNDTTSSEVVLGVSKSANNGSLSSLKELLGEVLRFFMILLGGALKLFSNILLVHLAVEVYSEGSVVGFLENLNNLSEGQLLLLLKGGSVIEAESSGVVEELSLDVDILTLALSGHFGAMDVGHLEVAGVREPVADGKLLGVPLGGLLNLIFVHTSGCFST